MIWNKPLSVEWLLWENFVIATGREVKTVFNPEAMLAVFNVKSGGGEQGWLPYFGAWLVFTFLFWLPVEYVSIPKMLEPWEKVLGRHPSAWQWS